jgi:N-acetylglucosaminyl-diphospho-decaprenol L-rhamnosyltransferase
MSDDLTLAGSPEQTPSLLVSLISVNNRDLLRRCLRSIPAACGSLRHDIVVIDNVSTDGSPEMVQCEFPTVRISINPSRQGFSANHNRTLVEALRARSHDYVCILNDDTELDPGSLFALVAAFRDNAELGAAGPLIRGTDGHLQPSLFCFPNLRRQIAQVWFGRAGAVSQNGWLNGSCLVLSLATLEMIGLLDERFFLFYEDADLCRRLAHRGLACAVIPAATMLHHGHSTVSNPRFGSAIELQMLRSSYLYYKKHFGPAYAAAALTVVRASFAARAAKAAIEGLLSRGPDDRSHRDLMISLLRYDPRVPLGHESRANADRRRRPADQFSSTQAGS